MKEGWKYKKLGEVCDLYQPKTISTKEMVSDGLYDVFGANGKIGKYHSYNHEDSEILMTCRGATCGNINISTPKSWINGNAMVVHIKDEKKLDRQFLVYSLINIDKSHIITGAAQPQITRQTLSPLQICFPSLSEQQSIVDYLDSAFAKIDAMKANAEKALNEAKALFQASLKGMLEPKEGWEESELKDIVDEKCPISYGIVQQGDHVEGGIPVVRPVDLNRKYITANGLKCTTESISSSYKRTILRGDEILLGVRGTTGIIGIATEELNGCNVNRGVVPLFFKDTICRDFIFYEMLSPAIQAVFAEKTTGATLKQINIKDLRTIVFSYPIIEIQQSIVATLDSLKSKVDRLQANFEKMSQECDALKQAILRQVFV